MLPSECAATYRAVPGSAATAEPKAPAVDSALRVVPVPRHRREHRARTRLPQPLEHLGRPRARGGLVHVVPVDEHELPSVGFRVREVRRHAEGRRPADGRATDAAHVHPPVHVLDARQADGQPVRADDPRAVQDVDPQGLCRSVPSVHPEHALRASALRQRHERGRHVQSICPDPLLCREARILIQGGAEPGHVASEERRQAVLSHRRPDRIQGPARMAKAIRQRRAEDCRDAVGHRLQVQPDGRVVDQVATPVDLAGVPVRSPGTRPRRPWPCRRRRTSGRRRRSSRSGTAAPARQAPRRLRQSARHGPCPGPVPGRPAHGASRPDPPRHCRLPVRSRRGHAYGRAPREARPRSRPPSRLRRGPRSRPAAPSSSRDTKERTEHRLSSPASSTTNADPYARRCSASASRAGRSCPCAS